MPFQHECAILWGSDEGLDSIYGKPVTMCEFRLLFQESYKDILALNPVNCNLSESLTNTGTDTEAESNAGTDPDTDAGTDNDTVMISCSRKASIIGTALASRTPIASKQQQLTHLNSLT